MAIALLRAITEHMPELAKTYTISPSQDSTVAVEVLGSGLLGRKKRRTLFFENFHGEMQWSADDPAHSRIVLAIDARSVACRDVRMSEKDRKRSTEFARNKALTTDRHPEIRFASTSVRAKELRGYVVTGALQICGTWRDLRVNLSLTPVRTPEIQLDGDAMLRLSDFGLPRPSAMFGLAGTKDEAVIHVRLWAVPE